MSRFTDFFKRARPPVTSTKDVTQIILDNYGGLGMSYYAKTWQKGNDAKDRCIQTNAQYISKGEFYPVLVKKDGRELHDYSELEYLLRERPNPTMCATDFWERTACYYYSYNNAFIYIEKDGLGNIRHLWSIDPTTVKAQAVGTDGDYVLEFYLNGKNVRCFYRDIVHLCRMVTRDMVFGDDLPPSMQRMFDLINLNYTGIENAIKTSTAIKFIGEYSSVVNEKEKERAAAEFQEKFIKGGSSIIFSDGKVRYTPVTTSSQYVVNFKQMDEWNKAVYQYYGVPEKVISGEANEDEVLAYYERTIEPFFKRATEELTFKLFTRKEYGFGNRIKFNDVSFKFMNSKTKLEYFNALREVGIVTNGTLGDLLGVPVPEDIRNDISVSQNYIQGKQTQGDEENGDESDEG